MITQTAIFSSASLISFVIGAAVVGDTSNVFIAPAAFGFLAGISGMIDIGSSLINNN